MSEGYKIRFDTVIGRYRLGGDEDGNINIYCSECETGGAPIASVETHSDNIVMVVSVIVGHDRRSHAAT